MISVSEAYKQAVESNDRVSYVIAKYGLYNKSAKNSVESISGNYQSFSNIDKLYNEIKDTNYNYISCEPNRVRLDETFYFLNDKTKPNENENLAYWSLELSNEKGTFTNNPRIIYYFNSDIEFTETTLYFQEVCEEFNITYLV